MLYEEYCSRLDLHFLVLHELLSASFAIPSHPHHPRLLLLDEPLCALDTGLRDAVRGKLRQIVADLDFPLMLVTHDPDEAHDLSDEVMAFPMRTRNL